MKRSATRKENDDIPTEQERERRGGRMNRKIKNERTTTQ
jgi:hypothetical protein